MESTASPAANYGSRGGKRKNPTIVIYFITTIGMAQIFVICVCPCLCVFFCFGKTFVVFFFFVFDVLLALLFVTDGPGELREFFKYATSLVIMLSLYMFQFTMLFTS